MNKWFNSPKKYFTTTAVSLSIWLVSLIINALFDLLLIGFTSGGSEWLGTLGLVLVFSAMFSLPGMIVLWLLILFQYTNSALFNAVFYGVLIISFLCVFVFFMSIGEGFGGQSIYIIVMAVVSSIISVLLHEQTIKNIYLKSKNTMSV